jgi:5-(aminomethyl)-3-furanmethanol phosphate kinase
VLTVVKVGGGLAGDPGALRAWCAQIGACGARHPLLVVPGGGSFADTVRAHDRRFELRDETAHWMAILAMDQFGWALSDLIPGAVRRHDLGPVRAGAVTILLPYALIRERHPLPASWDVTADSIAAWVAGAASAERLVLVKAVADLSDAELTVDELEALRPEGVDAYLPVALRAARVETWVIGREPRRLAELVETGRTTGTRVTA